MFYHRFPKLFNQPSSLDSLWQESHIANPSQTIMLGSKSVFLDESFKAQYHHYIRERWRRMQEKISLRCNALNAMHPVDVEVDPCEHIYENHSSSNRPLVRYQGNGTVPPQQQGFASNTLSAMNIRQSLKRKREENIKKIESGTQRIMCH